MNAFDIIGTSITDKAILVRIKNADSLARAQGTMASAAHLFAPRTAESNVHDEIAGQLRDWLVTKDIEADVSVANAPPEGWKSPSSGVHIWQDVAVGFGAVGLAAILWRAIVGRRAA